jgi:hypothetical protein
MTNPSPSGRDSVLGSLVLTLALCMVFGYSTPAHAYIDPGSGSMMLQLLLGGVAGFIVIVKLYWRRVSERLRFKSESRRKSE